MACIFRRGGFSIIIGRRGAIITSRWFDGGGTSQSRSNARGRTSATGKNTGRSASGGCGFSLTWGGRWTSQTTTGRKSAVISEMRGSSWAASGSYWGGRGWNPLCQIYFTTQWFMQFCSSGQKHGCSWRQWSRGWRYSIGGSFGRSQGRQSGGSGMGRVRWRGKQVFSGKQGRRLRGGISTVNRTHW